jgi:hypothetical protein
MQIKNYLMKIVNCQSQYSTSPNLETQSTKSQGFFSRIGRFFGFLNSKTKSSEAKQEKSQQAASIFNFFNIFSRSEKPCPSASRDQSSPLDTSTNGLTEGDGILRDVGDSNDVLLKLDKVVVTNVIANNDIHPHQVLKKFCLNKAGSYLNSAAQEAQKEEARKDIIDRFREAATLYQQAAAALDKLDKMDDPNRVDRAACLTNAGSSLFNAAKEAQEKNPDQIKISNLLSEAKKLKENAAALLPAEAVSLSSLQ